MSAAGTVFELQRTLEPIYTGGRCETAALEDGPALFMRSGASFGLYDPATGAVRRRLVLEEEESNVTVYTLKDAQTMVSCNTDNLLQVWSLDGGLARSWKAHASPILVMAHHAASPLLATGSADHGVRVWDSEKAFCTHNLRGVHGAIVTTLSFHPNPAVMHLFSASDDGSVAVWDLHESRAVRTFKGHVSAVTALSASPSGRMLLSAGRDQVVNLWSLTQGGSKPVRTVAVMEVVEAAAFLDNDTFYTAGEKGTIRVWEAASGKCLRTSEKLTGAASVISQVKMLNGELAVFTSDLFIHFLDQSTLKEVRLMVGHHGEITDTAVCNNVLAIGTNSPEIRLYERTSTANCCRALKGHDEAVISLASNEKYLLSGSRDHSAILWSVGRGESVARLAGHTDVVSAVALPYKKMDFVATGAADTTIKMWRISEAGQARLAWTSKAHDKDINGLVFTPNDKLLISSSQDKTVKVWKVESGALVAVLKGHKRGVWSAAVSPAEQLLATASADRSIRLWSLTDHTCLRTLEGHANSVLKVQFIRNGAQLVSAGSDGLIKVWDVKRGECISTIDGHADRIWTMITADRGETLITGDAAGLLKVWRDVSDEQAAAAASRRTDLIAREQQLSNMIVRKDYANAILLAMQLEQPQRLFHLFGQVVEGRELAEAVAVLAELVRAFDGAQIAVLLGWIRDWNTSLKRCYVAQLVLHAILKYRLLSAETKSALRETLSHLQPYTERHFGKVDELLIGSHLIDFVAHKIK